MTTMETDSLASTRRAAESVGVKLATFSAWARDRGLRAKHHVRVGSSTVAVWDLDEVFEAERRGVTRVK